MSPDPEQGPLQHAATERMLPERLGGFEVTGLLGRGGSGVVYAARLGDREVALKVLRQDQVPTAKERQRFLSEARNMARMNHPGVVSVVGVGELEDGRPYLAMERLHGTNLAEWVAAQPVAQSQALELFHQLASAVAAMHAAGLIHRDLKPENVMLVDGGTRAVLLDFGIARAADAPPSTTTKAGMQRGTPAVMAPERFFGARATLRSDVYELAVVLYVLLTRGLPWRDMLDARERLNPLRPREMGVALPDALEAALMRALSATADERPSSVAEFAGDVRRACQPGAQSDYTGPPEASAGTMPDRSELATAPTTAATTERTGSRFTWRAAALVAAALLLSGGAVAMGIWLSGDSESTGETARAQDDRSRRRAGKAQKPTAAAQPPVSVSAIPNTVTDAGAPAAPAKPTGAEAAPAKAPRKPEATPAKAPREPEPAPAKPEAEAEPAPKPPAAELPWCRKIADLYCTDEFKATEGSMAGVMCKKFREQVHGWEKLPPAGVTEMDSGCKKMYPQMKQAAAERIRFGESLKATGKAPPK